MSNRIHTRSILDFWSRERAIKFISSRSRPTESGCIQWIGATFGKGYGRIQVFHGGPSLTAHRAVYDLACGRVGSDHDVDHLCRNRLCVRVSHLEPVSVKTNVLRGNGLTAIFARRANCKHGHLYDIRNTRFDKRGGRSCRTCERNKWRIRSLKKDSPNVNQ